MSTIISVAFACLGATSYLFNDIISRYFCGDKLYTSNFSSCVEPYEEWGIVSAIFFSSTSALFATSVLLRDRSLRRTYLIIFSAIILVGTVLAVMTWDDSSGGFFININFGLLFLVLTGIVFVFNILAISWSHLCKSRILGYFLFLILLLTLLFYHEPIHDFSEQIVFGSMKTSGDCESAKLFRVRDKCLSHKGISEDNVEVCDLISANSPDFRNDCRDFIFRNRGSHGGDKKWCSYIMSSYQKKLCYE